MYVFINSTPALGAPSEAFLYCHANATRAEAGNCPGARHLCPHTRCDSWASPTDTDLGYSTRTRKDLQESMRLGKTHSGPPEGILATTKLSTPTSQRLQRGCAPWGTVGCLRKRVLRRTCRIQARLGDLGEGLRKPGFTLNWKLSGSVLLNKSYPIGGQTGVRLNL